MRNDWEDLEDSSFLSASKNVSFELRSKGTFVTKALVNFCTRYINKQTRTMLINIGIRGTASNCHISDLYAAAMIMYLH